MLTNTLAYDTNGAYPGVNKEYNYAKHAATEIPIEILRMSQAGKLKLYRKRATAVSYKSNEQSYMMKGLLTRQSLVSE
jgi:hypothetical protein